MGDTVIGVVVWCYGLGVAIALAEANRAHTKSTAVYSNIGCKSKTKPGRTSSPERVAGLSSTLTA